MTGGGTSGLGGRGGQTLVEFSVATLLTVVMLLFVVEMGRMLLVYMTVANAARAGVRYAVVHGGTRSAGAAADDASGPGSNPAQVLTVVNNFASAGLLTTSLLVVQVTYPGGSNAPGQYVTVTVVYPYDPLTTYFSKTLRLGSTTQGVIVF
ncbi:MAG: TadE family protein [Bryobacteraceae bacterium]